MISMVKFRRFPQPALMRHILRLEAFFKRNQWTSCIRERHFMRFRNFWNEISIFLKCRG